MLIHFRQPILADRRQLSESRTEIAHVSDLPVAGSIGAVVLFALVPLLTSAGRGEPAVRYARAALGGGPSDPLRDNGLTPAEQRVFELLLAGRSDAEIGAELHISRNTVKFHVRRVLRKTECPDRKVLRARFAGTPSRRPPIDVG